MAKDKKKTRLMVGLNYSIILFAILAIMMILAFVVPFVYTESLSIALRILWIVISAICALSFSYAAFMCYQTAILDEDGITFRRIRMIAKIKWSDIVKVETKDLPTLHSPIETYYKKWIVVHIAPAQEIKHGRLVAKKKITWEIKHTPKNAKAIKDYLTKYSSVVPKI
jgi:hypothetical protein